MKRFKVTVLFIAILSAFAIILTGCGGGDGSNDTVALSSAKAITAYSLAGVAGTINETAKTISVTMPYGTNVTALVATFTTTGASVKVGTTVQTSGTTPNNFTSPVAYTVTAADSSTATYIVTVTVATISVKAITAYSLAGVAGTINETAKTISVTMPYGTNVTALVATFTTTGASVKVGTTVQTSGTTPNNFTSPVAYTVTAADSSTATYIVTVTVAAGTYSASGTYTWNSSTGVLTMTWTSSNFVCNGPELGTETETGVTITSTTMTWPVDSMVWTRSSGTAGNIVGTWTFTDSTTGNSYTATLNANGTLSVVGNIVQCGGGGENPSANSQHWSGGYSVSLQYEDSPKTATSVSVTGPGITGSRALTYRTDYGSWNSWTLPSTQVDFGTTYPTGLPFTYTFSITDATGTWTATSTVSCFQEKFATNLSPTGTVTGTPTFSWTGIGDSSATYGVGVNDSNYNRIWDNHDVSGTSIVYSGPALTSGMTYNYDVVVQSSSACSNGQSFAQGSFTYQ